LLLLLLLVVVLAGNPVAGSWVSCRVLCGCVLICWGKVLGHYVSWLLVLLVVLLLMLLL
jgi:hypothetical protein